MSRVNKIGKNTFYATLSNIVVTVLGFVTRYIFIKILGETYLGINGLFTDISLLLSFAELGIGTSITAYMYKPMAANDSKTVLMLLAFFKRAYLYIMLTITVIGIVALPFLSFIVDNSHSVATTDLYIYYSFFLINNIVSYYAAYKDSYLFAYQEGYKVQGIGIIINIVTAIAQSLILLIWQNYILYLVAMTLATVAKRVIISKKISILKPEINEIKYEKMPQEVVNPIMRNVKSLLFIRLSSLLVSQTDSIIVSAVINIQSWGLVTNYNLIKTTIQTFLSAIQNVIIPSLGNVMAKEDIATQKKVFFTYNSFSFLLYGFTFLIMNSLSSPFIGLLFGETYILDKNIVFVLFLAVFLGGLHDSIGVLTSSTGLYYQIKWVHIIQAIVNLVASLYFVNRAGFIGVFLGTCVSALVVIILKPLLVWKELFNEAPLVFYKKTVIYFAMTIAASVVLNIISDFIFIQGVNIINFLLMGAISVVISLAALLILSILDRNVKEAIHVIVNLILKRKAEEGK